MSSKNEIAISVEGLSKSYTISHNIKHDSLSELISNFFKSGQKSSTTSETFWALKDVSFEIKKGECVGIIGRNGAGKSTLLKLLSRITEPTQGRAELRGRVGSLLEVGTGFHPDLTGRENVYLNGTILGMTRTEITREFDSIVDFSGTEKFLDTPVKRYSSGMYVRLAFAIAAHLNPEILIVDEVLAVGDAEFQKKCLGKMRSVASSGRTVILVSHNIAVIRQLCSAAVYLSKGTLQAAGEPESVISKYIETGLSHASLGGVNEKGLSVKDIVLRDAETGEVTASPFFNGNYYLDVTVNAAAPVKDVAMVIRIFDDVDQVISSICMPEEGLHFQTLDGDLTVRFHLASLQLIPRQYTIGVYLFQLHHMAGPVLEERTALKIEVEGAYLQDATNYYKAEHGYVRVCSGVEVLS